MDRKIPCLGALSDCVSCLYEEFEVCGVGLLTPTKDVCFLLVPYLYRYTIDEFGNGIYHGAMPFSDQRFFYDERYWISRWFRDSVRLIYVPPMLINYALVRRASSCGLNDYISTHVNPSDPLYFINRPTTE